MERVQHEGEGSPVCDKNAALDNKAGTTSVLAAPSAWWRVSSPCPPTLLQPAVLSVTHSLPHLPWCCNDEAVCLSSSDKGAIYVQLQVHRGGEGTSAHTQGQQLSGMLSGSLV